MIDINSYKRFMGINSFPQFKTEYYKLIESQGFAYAARAEFDPETKRHKLLLPSNAEVPMFLIFHELTHILDMETLWKGDRAHDYYLTGYMEYHASQIELMAMMNAMTIRDTLSFSMDESIGFNDYSVRQYLDNKLENAKALMLDSSSQKRSDGLGVLFNFLGLKSVCKMYAKDFKDDYTYRELMNHISAFLFMELREFFVGWIDDVDGAVALYLMLRDELGAAPERDDKRDGSKCLFFATPFCR